MTQLILTDTRLDQELIALSKLLAEGHLPVSKHDEYSNIILNMHRHENQELVRETLRGLRNEFPTIGSDKTMQGLAFVKKHGYAGDFEIIDKIYTKWHSDNPEFHTWDQYFHNQTAPQAVRNRKEFFKETLRELALENCNDSIHVLNLASGPCRDIFEFFEETQDLRFRFTCIELDPNAIAYAKNLLGAYAERVEFINQNIFRYKPESQYDLVWSAGLFDYFDDNTFTKILARFTSQPYIIIGNFSDANPTSGYMEVIGEWYLNCRGAGLLRRLAKDAGFLKDHIRIKHEPTEVNLFLHIKK
jgi:extracellular factor (EF) 3-hydroxypalmitic acid methyl ester biosynthesis protein